MSNVYNYDRKGRFCDGTCETEMGCACYSAKPLTDAELAELVATPLPLRFPRTLYGADAALKEADYASAIERPRRRWLNLISVPWLVVLASVAGAVIAIAVYA